MKIKVSTKGQIVLPAEIRDADGIVSGDEFEIEHIDRGEYRLIHHPVAANSGVVDWLLSCPVKDWFVPIKSDSTDTL